MPFWRISMLSLFLVALPYPISVSAEDAPVANTHAGNPLIGTWRHTDRRAGNARAEVTFVTFGSDGRYQVRLYNARLPGAASGAHIVVGRYDFTAPGRFVLRAREAFACPTGSNCVPFSAGAEFLEQAVTFRFDGPDRLVDGEGVVWRRVR